MTISLAIVKQKYSAFGGAEKVISAAVEAFGQSEDIRVSILARSWSDGTLAAFPHCEVVRCNPPYVGRSWRERSFVWSVSRRLKHYDLVQAHDPLPGAHIYRAGSGLHQMWLKQMTRDLPEKQCERIFSAKKNRVTMQLERSMFEHSSLRAVIANSPMVVGNIAEIYPDFDQSRVHLIWNGVNHAKFSPELRLRRRVVNRQALQLGANDRALLLLGSGWQRKGVETALRAMAKLPANTCLLVAGKESRPGRYQQLAQDLGITDGRLRWIGPTSDPLNLYAAADVFLLPSLYDQMPNASLEAMACGLPLVVSSTSGTRDLIDDGEQGFVRDWWQPDAWVDPILQCLDSAESMGMRAHQAVLPLSFERMIREWRQLYGTLLEPG
jgi:UDP-glucose:(heptosyl)LPS alpha-1,3-glucosyltransferase